ncbi:hypothetical protein [Shewanella sp. 4_MG-2023]|uniref:hypothetical protein n=1 Tax=Shewanella sp. 4_MG-2023 TaxID=3062652 RepID=UPI0026E42F28|nr:hypothetical protein [Shewanella sp. 4_MG-2023]MDO6679986.1 hypothetical protein [Shewanella sp. 4_MG-2023]
MTDIKIKPGDIILMNTNTIPGAIIKLGTVSFITHVAIAVSDNKVLESTPDIDNKDLRHIPLTEALKNATSAVVYEREPQLNENEVEELILMYKKLKENPKQSRYHIGIAGAAGVPAIINVSNVIIIIGISIAQFIYGGALVYLAVMLPIAFWGLRIIRQTSRWLAKKHPNNWFTREIEGSYCSGFVAKAEKELNSKIWGYINNKATHSSWLNVKHSTRL